MPQVPQPRALTCTMRWPGWTVLHGTMLCLVVTRCDARTMQPSDTYSTCSHAAFVTSHPGASGYKG